MNGRPKSNGLRLNADAEEAAPLPTTIMSPGMVDDLMDQTRDGFMHDLGDFGETALLEVRKLEALLGDEYKQVDSEETKVVPSGQVVDPTQREESLPPVVAPGPPRAEDTSAPPRTSGARGELDPSRSPHASTKVSQGLAVPAERSEPRTRDGAFLVPLGTIVAIAGLVVLGYSGYRATQSASVDASEVVLDVRSDPAGAEVVFDGQARGKAPLELRLPRDAKRRPLRVEAPGHVPYEVELATDTSALLDVSLEPTGARAPGGRKP